MPAKTRRAHKPDTFRQAGLHQQGLEVAHVIAGRQALLVLTGRRDGVEQVEQVEEGELLVQDVRALAATSATPLRGQTAASSQPSQSGLRARASSPRSTIEPDTAMPKLRQR